MSDVNSLSAIEVISSGKALGAEVRGIDFAQPVPDEVRDTSRAQPLLLVPGSAR